MGEEERDVDVSRRDIGALLGALGGALGVAALSACSDNGDGSPEQVAQVRQPWTTTDGGVTGTNFLWVDTIKGPGTSLYTMSAGSDIDGGSGTSAASPVVVVGGYSSPGDGGEGVFYWSEATITDDGGTKIVPTTTPGGDGGVGARGKGWVRIYSGPLNVRWFGATGLATTADDYPAIARAGAAMATTNNPAIHFPAGTYNISQSISFLGDGAVLSGAGPSMSTSIGTTIKATGNNPVIEITSPNNIFSLVIENVRIAGPGASFTKGHGIYEHSSNAVQGLVVHNVSIYNCNGNGILLLAAYNTKIDSVTVSGCYGNGFEWNGLTTTLVNCFVGSMYPSFSAFCGTFIPCAYRAYAGGTLIGCNGVNSSLGNGNDWGVFGVQGQHSPIADQLGSGQSPSTLTSACMTLVGCNIESFARYGIHLWEGSQANFSSCSFVNNASPNTASAAILYERNDSLSGQLGMIDALTTFQGNAYTNAGDAGTTLPVCISHGGMPCLSLSTSVTQVLNLEANQVIDIGTIQVTPDYGLSIVNEIEATTTVAIGAGGPFYLSSSVYKYPYLILTGTLSASATIVLGPQVGRKWIIDATAVSLGGHTITLQGNGNNWGPIGTTSIYEVVYGGTGRLYVSTLS